MMLGQRKSILIIISAAVWYTGSIVLAFKAFQLFSEAYNINNQKIIISVSVLAAIILGTVKSKYIFIKFCKKNIQRISELKEPKIWLFFKPSFTIILMLMIVTGAVLSKISHGNHNALLAVGSLDLTIATALFMSSVVYWRSKDIIQGIS